ncbi:MAG: BatD family protein [Armatimonadota bacterium]
MSRHLRPALIALLPLGLPWAAWAEVDVHASLSQQTAQVGETVDLTIVVTGDIGRVSQPQVPAVDYLQVVSSGSSQNITFANGRMTSTNTYTFRVLPTREGTFTIPPIEITAGGQVYSTRPLTLNVVAATGRPTPAPRGSLAPAPLPGAAQPAEGETLEDVFARVEVDNESPYVGEQVTLTLSFYQSHRAPLLGSAEYSPPSTEGLVAEPLPDVPSQSVQLGGVTYEVIKRRTALFAAAPGEYTIGPATIDFRRSYMMGEETITTDPIKLRVRPLPSASRPADFTGVVGRLRAALTATTSALRVGEAATVRLQVSGTGDLRQLEAPELPLQGAGKVYPSGEQRQIAPQPTAQGDVIGGTAAFDYLVMPAEAGELTIGPVTVSYFDPAAERYRAARTDPLRLQVLPGEGGAVSLRPEGEELHYIREDGLGLRSGLPLTAHTWFWALQLLPVAGVGWALRRRLELVRRAADPGYRRCVEAAPTARRRLERVRPDEPAAEMLREVDDALTGYIAAKAGVDVANLSLDDAKRLLAIAGCPDELSARTLELLTRLRAGLYAPGSSAAPPATEAPRMALALIREMEAALR